jgi:hypothetical protein
METEFTYIQKDTKSIYVEFDFKLDEESNLVGKSWEDYKAGAWVLLTDGQLVFKSANPEASAQEVFEMQLTPVPEPEPEPERTLERARAEKIAAIDLYDNSDAVNSFSFNGANCWFAASERSTYKTSRDAAELLGEEDIRLPMAGEIITLPIQQAKIMLARLQRYADNAAIVTAVHRATVAQLPTIAAVDGYDYTTGYPESLTFNL